MNPDLKAILAFGAVMAAFVCSLVIVGARRSRRTVPERIVGAAFSAAHRLECCACALDGGLVAYRARRDAGGRVPECDWRR